MSPSRGTRECPIAVTVYAGEYLAYRTYLDSRIRLGKHYRIRATAHPDYLFHGKPVRLVSMRPAEYCYRMKFEIPESECTDPHDEKSRCIYTDNWQPEGIALRPLGPVAVPGHRGEDTPIR
jgi:hypothetical protein